MKKILWVSPFAPYDKVQHASGKTENFYIKYLTTVLPSLHIRLLSFCTLDEVEKLDLNVYKMIEPDIIILNRTWKDKFIRAFQYNLFESKFNPFNKYANFISNEFVTHIQQHVVRYKANGYVPDIIVLQWTQSVLLSSWIRQQYPETKIVSIEEDVAYLGYKRKINYARGILKKKMAFYRYEKIKRIELDSLQLTDAIVCNNKKDLKLLLSEHISRDKIKIWCPYFDNYKQVVRTKINRKRVIFYGAMWRKENYLSAIWFIEKVLPRLSDIEFLVIGGKPPKVLKKYESNRIKILGFVEDVSSYFAEALCLAAPLVLGAGIKIKVLEAMSAGVPVLTNEIGIEGIPAKDGRDYFLCTQPEDYEKVIRTLSENADIENDIGCHAKEFIHNHLNLEKSAQDFCALIESL